jgi:DNA-binding NarL/FixJ family response regulator
VTNLRIVVVDDQPLVRAGFNKILEREPDLEIVGEAADGVEALEVVARLRPDVVLMDIRMPRLDGLGATERLRTTVPDARVVVLTTYDLDEYVLRALRAGACGFLLKDVPAEVVPSAVRAAASGDTLISGGPTRRLVEAFLPAPRQQSARLQALSERERDVLSRIAAGRSNGEIAAELHLGETTVKTYVGRLLAKLDARDRVALVIAAYEEGLVWA